MVQLKYRKKFVFNNFNWKIDTLGKEAFNVDDFTLGSIE